MKLRDVGPILIVCIFLAAVIGYFSPKVTKKDDSKTEELAEEFIKNETGMEIDFTPDSQETEK